MPLTSVEHLYKLHIRKFSVLDNLRVTLEMYYIIIVSTIVFIIIPKYVASYVVQKLPKYVFYNDGDTNLLHHSTRNFTNDSNDVPRWFGGHAQAVQLRAAFHVYQGQEKCF